MAEAVEAEEALVVAAQAALEDAEATGDAGEIDEANEVLIAAEAVVA